MIYRLQNSNYYQCGCGGTFSVDLSRESFGIAPCTYAYTCDRCNQRKFMACREEAREMARFEMPVVDKNFGEEMRRIPHRDFEIEYLGEDTRQRTLF